MYTSRRLLCYSVVCVLCEDGPEHILDLRSLVTELKKKLTSTLTAGDVAQRSYGPGGVFGVSRRRIQGTWMFAGPSRQAGAIHRGIYMRIFSFIR